MINENKHVRSTIENTNVQEFNDMLTFFSYSHTIYFFLEILLRLEILGLLSSFLRIGNQRQS